MSIMSEFRDFAVRGSVVDLAVGVIIGAAFGKIVDSLVKDLIMPVISRIFGGLWEESTMSYAVQQFFLNGGSEALIVRVHNTNALAVAAQGEGAVLYVSAGGAPS